MLAKFQLEMEENAKQSKELEAQKKKQRQKSAMNIPPPPKRR